MRGDDERPLRMTAARRLPPELVVPVGGAQWVEDEGVLITEFGPDPVAPLSDIPMLQYGR